VPGKTGLLTPVAGMAIGQVRWRDNSPQEKFEFLLPSSTEKPLRDWITLRLTFRDSGSFNAGWLGRNSKSHRIRGASTRKKKKTREKVQEKVMWAETQSRGIFRRGGEEGGRCKKMISEQKTTLSRLPRNYQILNRGKARAMERMKKTGGSRRKFRRDLPVARSWGTA